mmetsp:Transcript_9367/g.14233  ORF Transcript_9367/g.14233 Transcript_9367/m.14233 type:complete len:117 (-) Transcript_9367:2-352(-)
MSKRKGYRIFIYGKGFMKSEGIVAKFTWEDQVSKVGTCIFKNSGMLAATIPDMGAEIPEGEHMVKVEVSLNGQQYSQSENVQFFYKSVDPNLTEEELKKLDEEDAKAKKPGGGKKK